MKILKFPFATIALICLSACADKGCTDSTATNYDTNATKDDGSCLYQTNLPKINFKFKFDPTQERLGNNGEPKALPLGHAAQTPSFNLMGAHYIELSKDGDIPAYNGEQLVKSPTTLINGEEAIIFDQALYGANNDVFFSINLADVEPGSYEYLRISLSYQNYEIDFRAQSLDLLIV